MKQILPWLLALLCLLPVSAGAASFSIPEHVMEVDVQPDGAGLFEETLTYQFDGSYNGMLLTLRHKEVSLTDLRLFVDGDTELERVDALDGVPYTYTAETERDATSVRAYAPGGSGQRVFRISYRIGGFARRYQDTARINYVFIHSETALDSFRLRIRLPGEDGGAIEPFVHGAMDAGQMTLVGGLLTLGPGRIAANSPLELDILFPQAWLSQARTIQSDMREEALAQEAQIAEDAAQAAAKRAQLARTLTLSLIAGLALYAVASTAWYLRQRRRYGTQSHILPTMDDALLDRTPVAEAQFLRQNSVSASGMTATLLQLADQGVLGMYVENGDTLFTYNYAPPDWLVPHQRKLLDWLFAREDILHLEDLDVGSNQTAAKTFMSNYNAWKNQVIQDTRDQDLTYDNRFSRYASIVGIPLVGLVLFVLLLRSGLWPLAIPCAVLAAGFAMLFGRIRGLTDSGEALLAAIEGFRLNYEDRLAENPDSVLRRAPLVMALGYMRPLADWMDAHRYDYETDPYLDDAPVYWDCPSWQHNLLYLEKTVREAQSHNAAIEHGESDSASSSSDSGFSGGSGGGNSYGAW